MSTVVKGRLVTGIGIGSHFIGMGWVREQILEKLGFDPYLGTLNLRMDEENSRRYHSILDRREGITIKPLDERYYRGKCYKSRINDRVDGAIVVPIVPDYPADLMEFIAPVNLRESLGLRDGGEVTVVLL